MQTLSYADTTHDLELEVKCVWVLPPDILVCRVLFACPLCVMSVTPSLCCSSGWG